MYGSEPALEKCSCICRYILLTLNAATGIWLRWSRGKGALTQENGRAWLEEPGWLLGGKKKKKKERRLTRVAENMQGEEERLACLSDQWRTLLDTWELWPMPSCRLIRAMNYETNKSVAEGAPRVVRCILGSRRVFGTDKLVIPSSSFYKPACIFLSEIC